MYTCTCTSLYSVCLTIYYITCIYVHVYIIQCMFNYILYYMYTCTCTSLYSVCLTIYYITCIHVHVHHYTVYV